VNPDRQEGTGHRGSEARARIIDHMRLKCVGSLRDIAYAARFLSNDAPLFHCPIVRDFIGVALPRYPHRPPLVEGVANGQTIDVDDGRSGSLVTPPARNRLRCFFASGDPWTRRRICNA
jgi:hypothetical protein